MSSLTFRRGFAVTNNEPTGTGSTGSPLAALSPGDATSGGVLSGVTLILIIVGGVFALLGTLLCVVAVVKRARRDRDDDAGEQTLFHVNNNGGGGGDTEMYGSLARVDDVSEQAQTRMVVVGNVFRQRSSYVSLPPEQQRDMYGGLNRQQSFSSVVSGDTFKSAPSSTAMYGNIARTSSPGNSPRGGKYVAVDTPILEEAGGMYQPLPSEAATNTVATQPPETYGQLQLARHE